MPATRIVGNYQQPRSARPAAGTVYFELHRLASERHRLLLELDIIQTKQERIGGRLAEIYAIMEDLDRQAHAVYLPPGKLLTDGQSFPQSRYQGLPVTAGGENLVRQSAW